MKRLVESVRRRLSLPGGLQARLRRFSGAVVLLLLPLITADLLGLLDGAEARSAVTGGGVGGPDIATRNQHIDAWLAAVGKRSLFKPAIPLPSRPMARESVNRVRGMLSVHGIMDREGQRVAYISIKGLGMKPYKVGDEVEELFKVTRIDPRKVEVEITGERLELEM